MEETNSLIILENWEKAKYAIEQCRTLDEVKEIRDKASALAAYAKQARESLEVQNNVAEIKIRAERRIGEFSKELPKAQGIRTDLTSNHDGEKLKKEVLGSVGIDPAHASRYESLASIPEKQFEEHIKETKEKKEELTTAGTLRLTKEPLPHVSHNSGENEWYTPPEYIKSVIAVMGGIDTDPASSEIANKTVGAKTYFTKDQDGLSQIWKGCCFCNPPYSQPLIGEFSKKITEKYNSGEITQAIVLVNNATETLWFRKLVDDARAVLFTSGRIRFLDPQGNPGAPLQGQAFIYFGDSPNKFISEFSKFGWGALL